MSPKLLTRRDVLVGAGLTGVSLMGSALFVAHNKLQRKHLNFIKCYDKSGNDKYVNPRYIRWIEKDMVKGEVVYNVCSRMDGCSFFDTMRVHKDEQYKLKALAMIDDD